MDISKLLLEEKYQPKIYGLGEIYEQISVEKKRKRLKDKFGAGILFLCQNRNHSGRGLSLKELKTKIQGQKYQILASGFVDSPPWRSQKRLNSKRLMKNPLVIILARIAFSLLVHFEPIFERENCSHMIFVLGRKAE